MVSAGQARERIWACVDALGGAAAVSDLTKPSTDDPPAVSSSMLYKYRGGACLGRDSVNALSNLMPDIDADTWLAAMGVERAEAYP